MCIFRQHLGPSSRLKHSLRPPTSSRSFKRVLEWSSLFFRRRAWRTLVEYSRISSKCHRHALERRTGVNESSPPTWASSRMQSHESEQHPRKRMKCTHTALHLTRNNQELSLCSHLAKDFGAKDFGSCPEPAFPPSFFAILLKCYACDQETTQ